MLIPLLDNFPEPRSLGAHMRVIGKRLACSDAGHRFPCTAYYTLPEGLLEHA